MEQAMEKGDAGRMAVPAQLRSDGRRWPERLMEAVCLLVLFAFLFVFYSRVHPIVMHDGDDWAYASFTRGALPIWGYWNPTRVLPEILSPLCVTLAGYLIMPFTGDFFNAITVSAALMVSLMITVYVFMMSRLLKRGCGLTAGKAALLSAIFFACHFAMFRSQRSGNVYAFYSWNFNTYFYYMIPDLLNAALVMFWEADGGRERLGDERHIVRQGFLVLAGYMAIFSNLFCSHILTIYAGVRLLEALPGVRKRPLRETLCENAWALLTVAAWGCSAIWELNGARANFLKEETNFFAGLKQAAWGLIGRMQTLNAVFLTVCAATVALALVLLAHSRCREEEDRRFARRLCRFLVCGVLCGIYLLLLCADTLAGYMNRADVLFGGIFFLMAAVMLSMAYVVRRVPRIVLILPLVLVVLIFESDTRVNTFCESNIDGYSAETCNAINRAIMNQILEAAEEGLSYADIEVPANGPYFFIPDAMARAMLNCGLIDHEIVGYNVEIEDFFERYGI